MARLKYKIGTRQIVCAFLLTTPDLTGLALQINFPLRIILQKITVQGILQDNRRNCISEYCKDLPLHTHCENFCKNEKVDKLLKNRLSSTILQRENEFKNLYSETYTRCRQITNEAHENRNKFKLGKPIKIGRKVLLENHAKGLLKSKKLLELSSGPYTVTNQITNTTYENVHELTEQKKVLHRDHLVQYFPKEQEINKLVQDYSTNYDDLKAYYDRFNQ